MADVEQAIRRALESRLASTIVATTGSASISATATGYARAAGSFVSDGFKVGDMVKGSGFSNSANNGYGIITAVSALSMTVDVDRTAEAAGTRTLDVVMPEKRKYEGQKVEHVPSRPMVRAAVVPVSAPLVAFAPSSQPNRGSTISTFQSCWKAAPRWSTPARLASPRPTRATWPDRPRW